MTNTIHIAIIDDHVLFREGLAQLLSHYADINILVEADNGIDFMNKIEGADLLPDVCILDINMPLMNGHDTLQQINASYPDTKILILSMFDNDYSRARMLGKGVAGYLNKGVNIEEVYKALVAIKETGTYNTGVLLESVIMPHTQQAGIPYITDDELVFLKACCSQLSFAEIAHKLDITMPDVEGYKTVLYSKLQVTDRFGLIYRALNSGLF